LACFEGGYLSDAGGQRSGKNLLFSLRLKVFRGKNSRGRRAETIQSGEKRILGLFDGQPQQVNLDGLSEGLRIAAKKWSKISNNAFL
jgi:hypothetical protein